MLTVGELLSRWLAADDPSKPSTFVGYRSNATALTADAALAAIRVVALTPNRLRKAFARWDDAGATPAVIAGRFRALRAAIGWAYDERVIDHHPLRTMRGPARSQPRRPLPDSDVAALLKTAEARLLEAVANETGHPSAESRRHAAEQDLLHVRLAADCGARRGKLAGLQFGDLDGRVLHIARAVSADVVGTPIVGPGSLGHVRSVDRAPLGPARSRLAKPP